MFKHTKAFSGFSVNDLKEAKHFYMEVLGLEVSEQDGMVLKLHIEGSIPIILYPKTNHSPASFTVLNFPVPDVEKAVDELTGLGIRFEQYEGDLQTNNKGIFTGKRTEDRMVQRSRWKYSISAGITTIRLCFS